MVHFSALGLAFDAAVDYRPPGPPPALFVSLEPPNPEELEIVGLWAADAERDALFLLDSAVGDDIRDAALVAAREQFREGRSAFDEP